ncbi:MAG: hypothetical protein ACRD27_11005 [Terracidiphilus sp.]
MLVEKSPQDGRLSVMDKAEQVRFCECCGEPFILVPRLTCGRCGRRIDVKCQVYKGGGSWYAECLTFDLLSKGGSKEDAIRRIQIAMFSYVATVLDGSGSAKGLIPRRAPLSSWIRYYAHDFAGRLAYLFGRRIPLMIRSVPIQDAAKELKVSHCS